MFCQTVRQLMTDHAVSVDMDASLSRIREVFESSRFHHLVVTEDHKVRGVISDRDLLKHISPFIGNKLMERPSDVNTLRKRAHQIMHRQPVTVKPDMSATDATKLLLEHGVTCLPVVNDHGKLIGIVTWRDLLKGCIDGTCGLESAA